MGVILVDVFAMFKTKSERFIVSHNVFNFVKKKQVLKKFKQNKCIPDDLKFLDKNICKLATDIINGKIMTINDLEEIWRTQCMSI